MQHTRQQIINYLQANRLSTSAELAQALQLTAANIRHHLSILEKEGFIETVGQQSGRGRGRPLQVYALAEHALQDNLAGLASALLEMLAVTGDAPEHLGAVATKLLGPLDFAPQGHARLNQAVDQLNARNYRAKWEASPTGPRIILRNCPYAAILSAHPELCQLDAEILAQLLDQEVTQTARLERLPGGPPHCAFVTRA